MTKRAWLAAWGEADAKRTVMQPAPAWTPEGMFDLVYRLTGDEETARAAKRQIASQIKMREVMRGA